jgi:lipopolysaccharide transport system ATP-binding protein
LSAALRVERLGKRYKHYARGRDRLLEWASAGRLVRHTDAWVLQGVSFEVARGEGVAVVGANGAGKSTLMRLIAGTIQPSEGRIEVAGRVAALELGLGFHPDFTGRQNAFAAGELLGLRAADVERLLPEIEAFAEIGAAIEDPVRTYSSGMQLRLAFAVATAVRPEILIVDEVLAVGDAYFQAKCMARIRAFREQGTTLLFVSHDPTAVRRLCDRALLLDRGLLVRQGPASEVLDYYNALIAKLTGDYEIRQGRELAGEGGTTRSGSRAARTLAVELLGESGPQRAFAVGAPLRIRVRGTARDAIEALTVGFSIRDRLGVEVFGTNTHHLGVPVPALAAGEAFTVEFELPLRIGVGSYAVTVALHTGANHVEGNYDWWDEVVTFQVVPGGEPVFVGAAYLPTTARFARDDGLATDAAAAIGAGRQG